MTAFALDLVADPGRQTTPADIGSAALWNACPCPGSGPGRRRDFFYDCQWRLPRLGYLFYAMFVGIFKHRQAA